MRNRSKDVAIVLCTTVLVALVRWWRHDVQPLWTDEAHTMYFYVGKDISWIWKVFRAYPSELPLYGFHVRLWSVFGTSAAWIRLLSVVFSVLAVPVLMSLADLLGVSRRGKVFLGILLVFSAYLTYYAQEARCYSLLALLGALSLRNLLAIILREDRRFSVWAQFTLVNAALLYTHYFSFLTIAAYNVAVLSFLRERFSLRRWFLSQIIAGLLFLPWMSTLWRLIEAGPMLDMLAGQKLKWPLVSLLGPVPMFLVGKNIIPSALSPDYMLELGVLVAGCTAVAFLGLVGLCHLARQHGWRVVGAVAVLLVLPVLMACSLTALGVGAYNFFRIKYFSSLAPLAFVIAMAGAGGARDSFLGKVAATSRLRLGETSRQNRDGYQKDCRTPSGALKNRLTAVAWYLAFAVLILANCVGLANYHFNSSYQKDARVEDCVREMALREKTCMICVNYDRTMWLVAASIQEAFPDWRPEIHVEHGRFVESGGPAFVVRQGQFWDTVWPGGAGVLPVPAKFPARLWLMARVDWRERADPQQWQRRAAVAFFDSWKQRGYGLEGMQEFLGVQFCLAVRTDESEKK